MTDVPYDYGPKSYGEWPMRAERRLIAAREMRAHVVAAARAAEAMGDARAFWPGIEFLIDQLERTAAKLRNIKAGHDADPPSNT